MAESQTLIYPRYVKYHDGAGKSFLFLVTKEDEGEHLSGAVWCDDPDNTAGLTEGWNARKIAQELTTLPDAKRKLLSPDEMKLLMPGLQATIAVENSSGGAMCHRESVQGT